MIKNLKKSLKSFHFFSFWGGHKINGGFLTAKNSNQASEKKSTFQYDYRQTFGNISAISAVARGAFAIIVKWVLTIFSSVRAALEFHFFWHSQMEENFELPES